MSKFKKPLIYGAATLLVLAVALQFKSSAATPKAYDEYVARVTETEDLRIAYEQAKTDLCMAETDLATAKVKDYYNEHRELDTSESLNVLVGKSINPCITSEEGNFEPAGGGIASFLEKNAHPDLKDKADLFISIGEEYNIKPEVIVAIATADSNLGINLRTEYNLGNVGNTATASKSFDSWESGIRAIASTLNNQYLGSHTTIGQLSVGGGGTGKIYASSLENWNRNTLAALRDMYQDPTIDESFLFRIK
jgi:hypothetical protein|tara:strand:- start:1668 stop:2420 length:753 start_codon:yes stop_codon:yes gene_type:complete